MFHIKTRAALMILATLMFFIPLYVDVSSLSSTAALSLRSRTSDFAFFGECDVKEFEFENLGNVKLSLNY